MGLGPYKGFARLSSVQRSVFWFRFQVYPQWVAFSEMPGVHMVRYEDLLSDPLGGARALAEYLGLKASPETFHAVSAPFWKDSEDVPNEPIDWIPKRGPLINKGVSGRWESFFNDDEKEVLHRALSRHIEKMGYVV